MFFTGFISLSLFLIDHYCPPFSKVVEVNECWTSIEGFFQIKTQLILWPCRGIIIRHIGLQKLLCFLVPPAIQFFWAGVSPQNWFTYFLGITMCKFSAICAGQDCREPGFDNYEELERWRRFSDQSVWFKLIPFFPPPAFQGIPLQIIPFRKSSVQFHYPQFFLTWSDFVICYDTAQSHLVGVNQSHLKLLNVARTSLKYLWHEHPFPITTSPSSPNTSPCPHSSSSTRGASSISSQHHVLSGRPFHNRYLPFYQKEIFQG